MKPQSMKNILWLVASENAPVSLLIYSLGFVYVLFLAENCWFFCFRNNHKTIRARVTKLCEIKASQDSSTITKSLSLWYVQLLKWFQPAKWSPSQILKHVVSEMIPKWWYRMAYFTNVTSISDLLCRSSNKNNNKKPNNNIQIVQWECRKCSYRVTMPKNVLAHLWPRSWP